MSLPFDVADYAVTRAPVVDTFEYCATDPDTKTEIRVSLNEQFLRRTAEKMNARDAAGDLCPIVIGHTKRGAKEIDQPPKVGYLHRYEVADYNGKPTLFADHYIKKTNRLRLNGVETTVSAKEVAELFPRRSGEVWFGTHEIDPHALLGATTPHRNLGLLKLSSDGNGGFTYDSPGELHVTDEPKTGDYAEVKALLQQVLAMVGQLTETIHAAIQPEPQPGGGDGGSIDDILKGLDEPGEEKPKGDKEKPKGDEPKPAAPAPEAEEKVKLSRERDEALTKLARLQVTTRLTAAGHDATNEQLISDLIAQPEDVRDRFLLRLEKPIGAVVRPNTAFDAAVRDATTATGNVINGPADVQKVGRLARDEGVSFEVAAKKLGFVLQGR